MINILFGLSDIGNAIFSGLRTLLMSICNFLYSLVITCLDLFEVIGKANIVDNDIVSGIYQRVGLILGIFMLFRLTFSFVQMMISPDQISDKEKGVGSLVKKVLVVIVALAFTPAVFNEAYNIQGILLDSHVVEKVILGAENNDNMSEFAPQFSYYIFSSFYKKGDATPKDNADEKMCSDEFYETTLFESVVANRNFDLANDCLNIEDTDKKIDKVTIFDGWTAILIGIFVLYVLVMYIITLGMRVAKLAFLQLVAPIPILSYLSPKKDTGFQKWISQCVSTFLDVFIRLAIITFGVMLMRLLVDNGVNQALLESTGLEQGSGMLTWVNLILILGILLFIKKAPELLGEIFPSMGGKGGLDFGLGLKSRTDFAGKRVLGAGIAAPAMGAQRMAQNYKRKKYHTDEDGHTEEIDRKWWGRAGSALLGLATGAARGVYYGATNDKVFGGVKKGVAAQAKSSIELDEKLAKGGSYWGSLISSFEQKLGIETKYMRKYRKNVMPKEEDLKELETVSEATGNVRPAVDSTKDRAQSKITSGENATALGTNGMAIIASVTGMSSSQLQEYGITEQSSMSQALSATKLESDRLRNKLQKLDEIQLSEADFMTKVVVDKKTKSKVVISAKDQFDAAQKQLEAQKAEILQKYNALNQEPIIAKKLAEHTVSLHIVGGHNDPVMQDNLQNSINAASIALSTLRATGSDYEANVLQQMLNHLQQARANQVYTPVTIEGKDYNTAFELLDGISTFSGDIASYAKRLVAHVKEEKRKEEIAIAGYKANDGNGK